MSPVYGPFPFLLGGLTDSINPCAVMACLVFIMILNNSGLKLSSIVINGLAFIIAVILVSSSILVGGSWNVIFASWFYQFCRLFYIVTGLGWLFLSWWHIQDWFIFKKTRTTQDFKIKIFENEVNATVVSPTSIVDTENKFWRLFKGWRPAFFWGMVLSFLGSVWPSQFYVNTIIAALALQSQTTALLTSALLYGLAFSVPLFFVWFLWMFTVRSKVSVNFFLKNIGLVKAFCAGFLLATGVGLIWSFL